MKNNRCKKIGMLLILAVMAFFESFTMVHAQRLNGAGATFPYPVYSQWAFQYNKIAGLELNYQSIGSGGGIQQIKAKTVDFGASDAPLTKEELDQSGLIQFPMIMGGVVLVVNVEGVKPGQMRLTPEVLADIFLGKIKNWNDPAVKEINPGVKFPNRAITIVHRSDGSGTTWIFTNYLDKVSPEWHTKVGTDKTVAWPVGVAGKGNEGVSAYVTRIQGSIGYVEFAYALTNKMAYTQLRNSAGEFLQPTIETFQAAAANADWENAPGFYMVLTDQPGKQSWPITGASFILIYKEQKNNQIAKNMFNFFDWSFRNGDETARKLFYVPMPDKVVKLVEERWAKEVTSNGSPVWKNNQ
ncbi:MAG: phosphate ABC transporter substrate-binding protein PstS [Candidatus Latescibacterota bacterium]